MSLLIIEEEFWEVGLHYIQSLDISSAALLLLLCNNGNGITVEPK